MVIGYKIIYLERESTNNELETFQNLIDKTLELEKDQYRKGKIYQFTSLIYSGLEDYKKALEEIELAIDLDPDNFEYIFNKLYCKVAYEEFNIPNDLFEEYLELYPENSIDILTLQSYTYYYRGLKTKEFNKKKADELFHLSLNACDNILKIVPDHPRALNNKTMFLGAIGNEQEAIKTANKLIALYPNDGNNYDTYGHVLKDFKLYQQAIEQFEKAIEVDPNGFFVHISYLRMAECYKELGDYEASIEAVENSLEMSKKKLPVDKFETEKEAKLLRDEVRELLKNERIF